MQFKIEMYQVLIFAAILGAAGAMLWSSVSNKALGAFLAFLKDNNIDSQDKAVTLSDMNIHSFKAFLVKNKLKNSRVLRDYVAVVEKSEDTDKLEQMLSKSDDCSFYLLCSDFSEIMGKYISSPMSLRQIILSIIGLILSGCFLIYGIEQAASCASDKTETSSSVQEKEEETSDEQNENQNDQNTQDDDNTIEDDKDSDKDIDDIDKTPGPTIPTL